ncbi:MAG TPA: BTAD domain-containing putative transcriptional regulator [Candidatus Baltobacteraceae bacterium]|nr:BTAD domain-containing putative transcriptional regulator [Candidatus Baltobacteraceae bacterium]
MLLTQLVPRLAPATVRRARLERWLATHASLPLRLLVAPPGTGKTTLLLQRLANVPLGAYCAVPEDASPDDFIAAIGSALGLAHAPAGYVELLVAMRRIAATQPLELAIDDLDRARGDARAMAMKLVENLPENVSLIYCSRMREAVDAKNWVARGLAALCDARRLAFDVADIAALADACGVAYSNAELARLLEESDGWAIVVGGAVRAAADDERSLGDAYERWRGLYGEVFLDFIVAETERAQPEDGALVRALMNGSAIADPNALHRLEARGLFVLNDKGVMRPFKALQQARAVPVSDVDTSIPMVVRMLGRFSVSINGRDVEWVRRREAQIVKYLLVRQGASATRAELVDAFWPRVEKQLAAQSVRTACSNIRKALASIVGYARVDRYFRASTTIVLDLSSVVTDAGRFTAHAMAGDSFYNAGDLAEAAQQYQAAEKIYAGRLFGEDALEPWFEQSAAALETRLGIILERLAEYTFAKGDMKHAAEYAYRAKLIRPDQQGVLRMLADIGGHTRPA